MTDWQRLDELVEYLRAHPEQHDQSLYGRRYDRGTACRTVACAAGTAGLLFAPERIVWRQLDCDPPGVLTMKARTPEGGVDRAYFGVAELARELLDLTPNDADDIFHHAADLDGIEAYVEAMRIREARVPA